MATDARGHAVPASTDHPARSALLTLTLSMRDPIPVANAADRASTLATLAGLSPAITPSTSNPVFFHQADMPAAHRTMYTVDGVNFISSSGAFVWADAAARAAATTMALGDKGYQADEKVLYRYSGSAWKAWESDWITSFGFALTGTTLGTGGTFTGKYRYESGLVRVRVAMKLGTASFSFGGVTFALPVAAATPTFNYAPYQGTASLNDAIPSVTYEGFVAAAGASATDAAILLRGSNGVRVGPNASTPFVWAANDEAIADFLYSPA